MNKATKETIDQYVSTGSHPGNFLFSVLCNRLAESFWLADVENERDMKQIVVYVWNDVPANLWGSEEKVQRHLDSFKKSEEI